MKARRHRQLLCGIIGGCPAARLRCWAGAQWCGHCEVPPPRLWSGRRRCVRQRCGPGHRRRLGPPGGAWIAGAQDAAHAIPAHGTRERAWACAPGSWRGDDVAAGIGHGGEYGIPQFASGVYWDRQRIVMPSGWPELIADPTALPCLPHWQATRQKAAPDPSSSRTPLAALARLRPGRYYGRDAVMSRPPRPVARYPRSCGVVLCWPSSGLGRFLVGQAGDQ
jgi:hypothetical protein